MLIRLYWRACTFRGKKWGAAPVDAFWVEATEAEAKACIFARLSPDALTEATQMVERLTDAAAQNLARPYCFLVARDLSQIDPFPPNYPFHHMWNGYSPFREMPAIEIAALDDVRDIELPADRAGDRA